MLPQIELFCVGFAAVVDTVLLLVLLERINRPLTATWLKWAMVGATLWHVGSFLHATLRETTGSTATWLDAMCMITMAGGLLLLNCGILHGGLRINHTGALPHPPADKRYIAVYIPAMFLVAVAAAIIRSGSRDFIEATKDYHVPFLIWLSFANLTAAWLFLKNRQKLQASAAAASRFLVKFSTGLVGVTILAIGYILFAKDSQYEPQLRLITNLSPLIPTLVFAYYIFRRRLMPMVFERTLVYGAILLAVFYLHRLTLSRLMSRYSKEFQFDFVVIEGLLLIALVLAYQPLRNRFQEGLRYLIGGNVTKVRDATRQLSVELSRRSGEDVRRISDWFAEGVLNGLRLTHVHLCLSEWTDDECICKVAAAESSNRDASALTPEQLAAATALFQQQSERWIDRSRCHDATQLEVLRQADTIAIFRIEYRGVDGHLLLGTLLSGDRLSDEQLNTVALLVDQYAATIHNRWLEQARQTAERRAIQQEKLSTLGLLSGSLAHELKNPLSSMKTIATLLKEDLQENKEQVKDVELIVGEIDRLTQTTQRLLDFSRPSDATSVGVAPDKVIERLLHILCHLARQHGVDVTKDLQLGEAIVDSTDSTLSEILFNLIKNAIEAVREVPGPIVTIASHAETDIDDSPGCCIIEITDNGPGISAQLQDHIFEPFVTGKTDGTGLGLYLVGERVKELKGTISCCSDSTGTRFQVKLPLQET